MLMHYQFALCGKIYHKYIKGVKGGYGLRNFSTALVARDKDLYNNCAMDNPNDAANQSAVPEQPHPSAVEISGGQVNARDIVGGDVNIAGDSINAQTVTIQRGYSARQVQRLVLIVGGLVFFTALVFFILGAISASALTAALNRPLPGGNSPEASARMQAKIQTIRALAPGDSFDNVPFTEDEVSSYVHFVFGPAINITQGRARFMDVPGQIAIGGNLENGLPMMAQINLTKNATPIELDSAYIKILPTPDDSNFGWIPVTPLARALGQQLNDMLFGKVRFTEIRQGITISAASELPNRTVILDGIVK